MGLSSSFFVCPSVQAIHPDSHSNPFTFQELVRGARRKVSGVSVCAHGLAVVDV